MSRPVAARRRVPVESLERRAYLAATVAFSPATDFVAGTAPVALAAADFNVDGHQDLVVADATAETANVFFGTGTGTFTAGPVLALSAPPTAVLTGDFNGDGVPDIAVASSPGSGNAGTTVTVFLNNGKGTFGLGQQTTVEPTAGSTEPVALAAGDFNLDGHLDLVATDYTDGQVSVLLGTGTGTFAAPVTYGVGADPTAVAVGNFTSSGKLDVAVTATEGTTDEVILLDGTGTGQFTDGSGTALSATTSDSLAAADLTGDGKAIDLVVGNTDGTVTLLANPGTGAFATAADPNVGATPSGVAVGDLNVDGFEDVVTADGGSGTVTGIDDVTVIPGLGGGTVGPATQTAVGSAPTGVVVADFNGDGKPDVATADEGSGTVSVLLNDTAVTPLTTKTALTATPTSTPAGSAVTLSATVTPAAASTLTGESAPTGTVSFYDGTTLLGTTALTAQTTSGTATDVGVATLAVSTLSVGTHRLTAKYAADTAYAASASAATVETITATADSGPDLVATFSSVSLPATVAPGEVGTVKVKLTNQGNAAAAGKITDTLSLSLDATADAGDLPVTLKGSLAQSNLKLAVNASKVLTGTFTVPANAPLASYLLLVDVDTNAGVTESDAANDVAASPTAYAVVDQFGTVGGKKGVALTVANAAGATATFKLAGPGTGTVDVGDDGVDLTLAGTTAASAVTVTPAGAAFALHDLTAASAVGSIKASAVNVTDEVSLPAGATTVDLGILASTTVTAGVVRSLAVTAFGGTASLASLASLSVAGDDTGSIGVASNLGSVLIRGNLTGGSIAVGDEEPYANRLGSLRVLGAATGANVSVGSGYSGSAVPSGGVIGSVTVLGPVDATTQFIADALPKRAILGGVVVDTSTDTRFVS